MVSVAFAMLLPELGAAEALPGGAQAGLVPGAPLRAGSVPALTLPQPRPALLGGQAGYAGPSRSQDS